MPDNEAMGRYWNEIAGPRWVQRQAVQEARNAEMLEQLLAAAKAMPGEQVLDIGCGTGVTTEPYAIAVGPQGHVTAADISKPMLDAARQRIAARGLSNVTLLQADAQVHDFPASSFDLLTSRLGVMFFADPVAAFRNLHKALRPGGRLCMAVWGTIAESMHQQLPLEIAIRHLGPPAPPPHAPGPNAYGDRVYLRGILDSAGFADVVIEPRQFLVHGGDDAESAAEHAGGFGAVQRLMDEKGADDTARAAIVKDIAAAFAPYQTADGLRFPAMFLLTAARKT